LPTAAIVPATVCPVIVLVEWIAVAARCVDAVDVVNVTVAVVVDPVTRRFAGVPPHVGRDVHVVVVHPRVDDSHDDIRARFNLPRFRRIDVRIRRAARLARVVKTPQAAETRIVGREARANNVVGLGVLNVSVLAQACSQLDYVELVIVEFPHLGLDKPERTHRVDGRLRFPTFCRPSQHTFARLHPDRTQSLLGTQLDDQLARLVFGCRRTRNRSGLCDGESEKASAYNGCRTE